jgi:hypothetical protein
VLASPALADLPENSIAAEVGVASRQSTPDAPRSGQVSESLWAVLDLGKGWALDLSTGITSIEASRGILGRELGSRGATVLDFGSGLSWEASDHVMLGLSLGFSPRSTLFNDTTVAFTTLTGQMAVADALLEATTRTASGGLFLSYDTAGDSDLESAVDAGLAVTHFDTDQRLVAMRGPAGTVVTAAEVLNQCLVRKCSQQLLGLLRQRPAAVNQIEARLGITETLWEDTDVGLGGSWYFYDRDPTQAGFFSLMAAGRGAVGFGTGVPLAPLQWRIRPEVAQRFGDLVVKLWLAHGAYVSGEGTSNLLGTRLQYRFARSFRMWLSASWQRDTDAEGNSAAFTQVALGAMVLF